MVKFLRTITTILTVSVAVNAFAGCPKTEKDIALEALLDKLWREKRLTVEDMAQVSDCIVIGKVRKLMVRKDESFVYRDRECRIPVPMPEIRTYVTLVPKKFLRKPEGVDPGKKITIRYPGGEVIEGGIGQVSEPNFVGGSPKFDPGQEVLVFLVAVEDGLYYKLVLDGEGEYTVKGGKVFPLHGVHARTDGTGLSVEEVRKRIEKALIKGKK
ncbi:MAG: hypothetical protein QME66_10345 [Candidatus Eisenbacteria bacterium]|nr:hypothetical protein [Candidatus Eisenbacteria bacterium]